MNKSVYEIKCDHILLNTESGTITLDEFVIGVQIRVLANSGEPNMTYGLNEPAGKVPLNVNDLPGSYGGFHVDNVPCIIRGELNYRFESNTSPLGLVVLTRLVPTPTGIEICN